MRDPGRLPWGNRRFLAAVAVGALLLAALLAVLVVRTVTDDDEAPTTAARRGGEQRLSPPSVRTSARTPKLRRIRATPPPDPEFSLPAADPTSNQVWNELTREARAEGRVPVIVILKGDVEPEGELERGEIREQRAEIDQRQNALLEELGGRQATDVDRLDALPIVAMDVTPAGLAELRRSPLVASVEEDEALPLPEPGPDVASTAAAAAAAAPPLEDWWDLPRTGVFEAWQNGFDGRGRIVAVLDTGVQSNHPWLAGKVVNEACFSANGNCPNRRQSQFGAGAAAPCGYAPHNCGHGTHVAHTAAGLYGVARGASIVAVQVFSRFTGSDCAAYRKPVCALTWTRDQLKAMDHVVRVARANPFRIAAVNLSLGGGRYTRYCDRQQTGSFQWYAVTLRSLGVATVVSSGNAGYTNAIGDPACNSGAISIGSTTLADGGADAVSNFSNSAEILAMLAPGEHICSAIPGNLRDCWPGTSMAAPHVAGAFASLAQLQLDVMRWPYISVPHAVAALRAAATPVRDHRNGITRGRLNVWQALVTLYNTR